MAKNTKKVEMSVAEYVAEYNSKHTESITRHDVYKMIKDGKIKAHRKEKSNVWVLEFEAEEEKEYRLKDFVDAYNKKHVDEPITVAKARKLAADGVLKGRKVLGAWFISTSPKKKLNNNENCNDITLERIRSLSGDILIDLIVEALNNSLSLQFLNLLNIKKGKNVSLLIAPSKEDKIILINSIANYLLQTNLEKNNINEIIENIVDVYNKADIVYINGDKLSFNDLLLGKSNVKYLERLNFIRKDKKLYSKVIQSLTEKSKLSLEEFNLFKIQMFIFASVFINMDEFLKYVYHFTNSSLKR